MPGPPAFACEVGDEPCPDRWDFRAKNDLVAFFQAGDLLGTDNISLKDFLTAAKILDPKEREEQHEERAAWRSYGEIRSSAFNDLVQGAVREQGRSQQRGEDQGFGRGFTSSPE